MYERGLKLYHEYVAHGESNTMAKELSVTTPLTATLHSY